jgi:hypothetical protein
MVPIALLMLAGHVEGYVPDLCIGEFQHCPTTGECTLFECDDAGPHCEEGEYRCPISNHCVKGAEALVDECPGIAGTHLDHTLPTEDRVTILIGKTSLTERINQLTNAAPSIQHLGIPVSNLPDPVWWTSRDHVIAVHLAGSRRYV